MINDSRINAIDVTTNGGSITVNARALEIANSSLSAGTGDDSSFGGVRAGDITLNASDIRATGATIDNAVRGSSGNGGMSASRQTPSRSPIILFCKQRYWDKALVAA